MLLLIPVWLLAARTHASSEHWLAFGFFDKRWLLATFLLGTIGSMLVVTGVSQVVRAAGSAPGSWQAWARAAVAAEDVPAVRATPLSWRRTLALSAGAVALAAFFFAPPWHVALSQVDAHETPMLGGVQAIANGAVPYIGPSAVQYGPGSELIHYLYLDEIGGFNVEAFRQSTVLIYWLAATIFFLTILLRVPTKVALLACLASVLVFPTLQMIAFQPDGSVDNQIKDTMEGVWGWPNAMRYVGVFAVAMVFPAVARRPTRRSILLSGAALGLLWGLTCFIAQENLAGGAIALAGSGGPARAQPDDRPPVASRCPHRRRARVRRGRGRRPRLLRRQWRPWPVPRPLLPGPLGGRRRVQRHGLVRRRGMGAHVLRAPLPPRGPLPALARQAPPAASGPAMGAGARAARLGAGRDQRLLPRRAHPGGSRAI